MPVRAWLGGGVLLVPPRHKGLPLLLGERRGEGSREEKGGGKEKAREGEKLGPERQV